MSIPDRIYTKDRPIFDRLKKLALADLYRVPVGTLPLNKRALDTLEEKLRVRTIGELVVLTRRDLLKQHNFGLKSLKQLDVYLAELGLVLGTRPDKVPNAAPAFVAEQQTFEWAKEAPAKSAREIELEVLLADATAMVAKMAAALQGGR